MSRRGSGARDLAGLDSETLLRAIREYCHASGMAGSTFGRLTINDGKQLEIDGEVRCQARMS